MNITVHAGGKLNLDRIQQSWFGDESAIMQTAIFAGQEMVAITDDAGAFDLMYLGFQVGRFQTMEIAKAAAPAFARNVLAHMTSLVKD